MVLTAIAALALARQPLASTLMQRSRLVARVGQWNESHQYVPEYWWLTPREFIFETGSEPRDCGVYRYRVGEKPKLDPILTKLLRWGGFYGLRLSPDGKSMLWSSWEGKQYFWCLAGIDGQGLVRWPQKHAGDFNSEWFESSYASWTPEGDAIVETFGSPFSVGFSAWRRSVAHPLVEERLPDYALSNMVDASVPDLGPGSALTMVHDTTGMPRSARPKVSRWASAGAFRGTVEVAFPSGTEVLSSEVSHSGKKRLWSTMNGSLWDANAKRTPRKLWPTKIAIWLSDADGTGLVKVAEQPFGRLSPDDAFEHFGGKKWLPGDRAISFVYFGQIRVLEI